MNKNNVKYPEFSVAMSVYKNDNAEWFDLALESVINQTVKPSEIVLVVDGAIPQRVCNVIDKYIKICDLDGVLLKVIQLPQNQGLGNALKIAIHNCEHEVIARMDSDDIAVINRFEQQLNIMLRDPGIDIVGGDIQEFIDCLDNILS